MNHTRQLVIVRHPRLITASNHWLLDRIASAQFRPDLFYCLNLMHVVFPPGTVRSRDSLATE
jgi:transcriptional regulator with PAS, ATPase and Fis domain